MGLSQGMAYLKYRQALPVNPKRIYRLMKENNLLVEPNWRLKATRAGKTSKNNRKTPESGMGH